MYIKMTFSRAENPGEVKAELDQLAEITESVIISNMRLKDFEKLYDLFD